MVRVARVQALLFLDRLVYWQSNSLCFDVHSRAHQLSSMVTNDSMQLCVACNTPFRLGPFILYWLLSPLMSPGAGAGALTGLPPKGSETPFLSEFIPWHLIAPCYDQLPDSSSAFLSPDVSPLVPSPLPCGCFNCRTRAPQACLVLSTQVSSCTFVPPLVCLLLFLLLLFCFLGGFFVFVFSCLLATVFL